MVDEFPSSNLLFPLGIRRVLPPHETTVTVGDERLAALHVPPLSLLVLPSSTKAALRWRHLVRPVALLPRVVASAIGNLDREAQSTVVPGGLGYVGDWEKLIAG